MNDKTTENRHFPLKNKCREWRKFVGDEEKINGEGKIKIEEIKEMVHVDKSYGM